jgi:pimeloyl-ACP methyl ester carboxylesterase
MYFLLFKQPWLPEVWLGHMEGKEVDSILRGKKMGVLRQNAITLEDSERIRTSLARPGRLTAALNYYRSAMGYQSETTSKFITKTCAAGIQVPTLQIYADCDGAFCPSMFENLPRISAQNVIKLENCSHWAQQDRPDVVNKYIHTFVMDMISNSS